MMQLQDMSLLSHHIHVQAIPSSPVESPIVKISVVRSFFR